MIEICGGSWQLIRILNRLGCATSPDTHDRFVTQHAMVQHQSKIWDKISSNTFTIASVDNFDMLQSYAAVHCGDQQRLNTIREVVSERIINEEDRVPTITSLWRHWLRCCWVSQMWQHSSQADIFMSLPPPEDSEWLRQADGNYVIDWEAAEVQQMVRNNIKFLTKGCSCTKGCKSLRCGCRKRQSNCGPGCLCQGCNNINIPKPPEDDSNGESDEDTESSYTESDEESELVEEEVITDNLFFNTYYDIA